MTRLSRAAAAACAGLLALAPASAQSEAPPPAAQAKIKSCPGNANPLGVFRTVEIDTAGGPGFGFDHYKAYDFLEPGEVVLTFDDGPVVNHTHAVLASLAAECTKAIFFPVGKQAVGYPEIVRQIAKEGHSIGSHTFLHLDLRTLPFDKGKSEFERGFSAIKRALGTAPAPFFRYPALRDTPETLQYAAGRNIAVFSTDIDSFDFRPQKPEKVINTIMTKLEKKGKGILLMHAIQPSTAAALPTLLRELKAKGYKVVHIRAKAPVKTLAEFDQQMDKEVKGLPAAGAERPLSSVVRTVESD